MEGPVDLHITDSEREVMRVVWAKEQATSKEISEILADKMDWKEATTKTFLGRLVQKGLLRTEKEGRRYIYSSAVTEESVIRHSLKEHFHHICSRNVGSTIAFLLEDSILSHDDLALLAGVLEKKRKSAVEVVPCNCIPGQCRCTNEQCIQENQIKRS